MWKKLKILGAGSSGTVYLASPLNSSTTPPTLAAVKSADLNASSALQTEAMFLGELRGSPNIIQCFGEDRSFEKDQQQVYNLLLEYAPGGSLTDLIEKNNATLPESHVACYTHMLLNGISSMHECETIHCDIWSLGCVVAEMMSGEPIWPREMKSEDLLKKLMSGEKPTVPENMSEDGKDFLRRCFKRAVHRLWTADMLLHHPFIVKNLHFLDWRRDDEVIRVMKNPFASGFGDWVSTYGLFTASSMDCSGYFECQNLKS